jgi:Phage P22-like portal protein
MATARVKTLTSKSKRKDGKQSKQIREDEELIEQSLRRFQITADFESESRTEGLKDLRFSIGTGQWDGAIKAARDIEGKPCLTINRIPTFIRQYTGEERQHRPAMLVDPVGSGTDPETAEICQGVLRHIEQISVADYVYDMSYDMMLRIGWHHWRINSEYLDERSFDQEPRIEIIENSFATYLSPIRKPDGTDPLWGHVIQDMSRDEYKEEFPDSKLAKSEFNFTSTLGNAAPNWVTKDGARVAEYWWIDLTRKNLCLLDDGRTKFEDELEKGERQLIVNQRDSIARKVCCVKHNAVEILKRYEWLGRYIPIVEVSGTRLYVDGKIYRAGIVRDAQDPQRVYNFEVTGMAEQIALAPKDPLYVAEGSIAGHEEEYRQANRVNYPYLYYKAFDENGKPLPPPTRASREPPIEAMARMVQQSDYDLKSVIGIYGPGLGEQGPAQESGFAILTRQQQSDTGSVNWSDNLNRSIHWQGKILLDLFPKLITSPRIQRIVNPDDTVKHAVIYNSQAPNADAEEQMEEAQALLDQKALKKVYDVGLGKYDVVLSSGPTYRTARKEQFAALTAIITANPQMLPILGALWADCADWPGARKVKELFQKMMPPNLQDPNDQDPGAQIALLQSQLQQLGGQHQQLVVELNRASDTIRTERLALESKERIAALNNQTQVLLQQLKSHDQAANAQLVETLQLITNRLNLLGENVSIAQDAGQPPMAPALPGKVEPKPLAVTPAAPVQPVPGTTGPTPGIAP